MSVAEAIASEQSVDEVRESLSVTEKGQPANTIDNCRIFFFPSSISACSSSRVFSLGFVIGGRSFLPVGVEKGQSISRLPFWVGIKFYCVLFYLTLIVLTLYLNGIFHHHYSIIVLIADCTALYLPSFECAAKQVIKYAFPSFSYRTTML